MRPALPALLALGLLGCRPPTHVVVAVENGDLVIPDEVRTLRIVASNPEEGGDGGREVYRSQEVVLCPPGSTAAGCVAPPVTVSFSPGPTRPDARVRVQVDAFDPAGAQVSSDAATFRFTPGQAERVTFVLRRACLQTRCALEERACGAQGGCVTLAPQGSGERPDLAPAPGPPVPIERVSVIYDTPTTDSAGVVALSRAQHAQPGDRLVAFIAVPGAQTNTTVAPGWTVLGSFGRGSYGPFALTRVAGEDEAANAGAYRFLGSPNTMFHWVVVTYRHAGRVLATYESAPMGSAVIRFPSVDVARAGSVLGSTTFSTNCARSTFLAAWFEVDERVVGAGPTGEIALECTAAVPVLQYLVEPE